MSNKNSILILLGLFWLMVSCHKTEITPTGATSMKDLKASDAFVWNTTNTLLLNIYNAPKGLVEVSSQDQSIRLLSLYSLGNKDVIIAPITIPSYIKTIKVNGTPISIKLPSTDVYLTNTKQSASNFSLLFNGVNQWVKVPASNFLYSNQLSFTAWVKSDEHRTAKIIQKGDWDGSGLGLDLWKGWQASFAMNDGTSTDLNINARPALNTWYHIASTYDGNSACLYINGELVKTIVVEKTLRTNNRDISIASDNGNQKFFAGNLDELAIYAKALTQAQIQQIMSSGSPLASEQLKASYNFNEATGTTALDASPNNYHGQVIGASYSTNVGYAAFLDDDNDGIANNFDDYPIDALRAFNNFWPSTAYGSLAFEDLWPATGDYDFNDLVCDYQFKVVTNAANHVVEVFAMFSLKAIGGSFHNGFGFQLNPDITNYALINVTGTVLTSNYIQLQGNGLESGQNLPTFIVFDDAWDLVSPVSGFTGFNTVQGAPWSAPYNTQLQITFTNEQLSLVDLNLASFNPFIIVNEVRGREVHLPDYEPSSKANPSLFGQQADNSIPVMHRYYKTQNNLPWAINIPTPFDYSIEKCDITQAHLKMINWVESGGSTFQDWYLNLDGYRNQNNIFQH